jgi:hypothetical protein
MPEVVANRRTGRAVGIQRNRRHRSAVLEKAADQLRGDVLGVGRRAAVTGKEQPAVAFEDPGDEVDRVGHRRGQRRQRLSRENVFLPDTPDALDLVRTAHAGMIVHGLFSAGGRRLCYNCGFVASRRRTRMAR